MALVTFSDKRWPLVTLAWPSRYDASHIETGLAQLLAVLQRQQPFVIIADLREAAAATAEQSARVVAFMEEQRNALVRLCKGHAVLVSSLSTRSAVAGLVEQLALPVPFRAVATLEDAEGWCWRQLEEARCEERRRRSSNG